VITDAMVRVLRDLAAREDLPREVFMGRRFESSFRDFATTREQQIIFLQKLM
jgi:hypothetical protein